MCAHLPRQATAAQRRPGGSSAGSGAPAQGRGIFGVGAPRKWEQWSPYEKLDPNLARSFEGPASGPGAIYAYKGNSNVGEGRLEFIEPFPANNQVTFKLDPSGTGTRVTWSLSGPNTLMGKEMSPFMDGFIGKSMEQGLAALDTAAQAEAKKLPRSSQAQAR